MLGKSKSLPFESIEYLNFDEVGQRYKIRDVLKILRTDGWILLRRKVRRSSVSTSGLGFD
jgi:hypothetical protein